MQLKSADQVSRFREGRDGFTAPQNWAARGQVVDKVQ